MIGRLAAPSRISRSHEEYVLIALGKRGIGGVIQDGRETVIHPGEFAIYDTTSPYELRFDDAFTQTIFKVPRDIHIVGELPRNATGKVLKASLRSSAAEGAAEDEAAPAQY